MTPGDPGERAEDREYGEDLAEFVLLLLDALEVPEVRDRVRDALGVTQTRPTMVTAVTAPAVAVPPRPGGRRRGGHR